MSTAFTEADIEFNNPCWYPFDFQSAAQTSPAADKYSDTTLVVTLNKFMIDPPRCKVAYECSNVERVDGTESKITCADILADGTFNSNEQLLDGTFSFVADYNDYLSGKYPPGVYTVTIKGTASKSIDQVNLSTTFTITLLDPCDPPQSFTVPTLSDTEYMITDDNAAAYTHPTFNIEPFYCVFNYSYQISDLLDEQGQVTTAIQQDATNQRKFNFYYDRDLAPLTQEQTVTVTVTSYSIYGTTSPITEQTSFKVTFTNPCIDDRFVWIEKPTLPDIDYTVH